MKATLTAGDLAPTEARNFVSAQLAATILPSGVHAGDPVLVVSELVTNAVKAGAHSVEVEVEVGDGRIDLTVLDDAPGWPTPQRSTLEDVNGRGLAIVDRLAHQWQVRSSKQGKRVTVSWLDR